MPLAAVLLAGVVAAIVGAWAWLGAAVEMPQAPFGASGKLHCISYAPFRGSQTPLDTTTHIAASQIDQDFALLASVTRCVLSNWK